jgi:hypothetical protein
VLVLHNCFRATGTKNHDFRALSGSAIVGSIPRRALGCFRASQATHPPRAGLLVTDSIYRLHITERSVMY